MEFGFKYQTWSTWTQKKRIIKERDARTSETGHAPTTVASSQVVPSVVCTMPAATQHAVGPIVVLAMLHASSAFLVAPTTVKFPLPHSLKLPLLRTPPPAMRTLEWRIFGVEVPVVEAAAQQPDCKRAFLS